MQSHNKTYSLKLKLLEKRKMAASTEIYIYVDRVCLLMAKGDVNDIELVKYRNFRAAYYIQTVNLRTDLNLKGI